MARGRPQRRRAPQHPPSVVGGGVSSRSEEGQERGKRGKRVWTGAKERAMEKEAVVRERMKRGIGGKSKGRAGQGCIRERLDANGRCRIQRAAPPPQQSRADGGWSGGSGLAAKDARQAGGRVRMVDKRHPPQRIRPPPHVPQGRGRCKMRGRRPPLELCMGDWRRNHRGARVRRREPPTRRKTHLAHGAAGEIIEVRFTQSVSMAPRSQMTREQILVGWNEQGSVQSTRELSRASTNKRTENSPIPT